jgi:hypothetical protein
VDPVDPDPQHCLLSCPLNSEGSIIFCENIKYVGVFDMNCCLCRYCLTEGIHAGDVSADLSADGILVLTIRKLPQGLEFSEKQLEKPAAEQQPEQPAAEQLPGETFSRRKAVFPINAVW